MCRTTTPLCPIASFTMCNVARLQRTTPQSVLDPFCRSCSTLLSAAHLASLHVPEGPATGCRSVGIEVCHNGHINREHIVKDFTTRCLPPPVEIIRGDCFSYEVRERARNAIGVGPFDLIVTDPPYGIREAMSPGNNEESPLTRLFHAIDQDRRRGSPLLKRGGRLVAFVPVRQGEQLEDCLLNLTSQRKVGLVMNSEGREQVLSNALWRWLVSFRYVSD